MLQLITINLHIPLFEQPGPVPRMVRLRGKQQKRTSTEEHFYGDPLDTWTKSPSYWSLKFTVYVSWNQRAISCRIIFELITCFILFHPLTTVLENP